MIKLSLASIGEEVVAMCLIQNDDTILRIAVDENFLGLEGANVKINDAIPNEPINVEQGNDFFDHMMDHFQGELIEVPPEDVETVGFILREDNQ